MLGSPVPRTGYEVLLSAPELTIQRCTTMNPATRMVGPTDGTPHDCIVQTDTFMKIREVLYMYEPIAADLTLFVDGSCFKDDTGCHSGYGVAQLNNDGETFFTVQARQVDQPCSAQLAELKALTVTCRLGTAKMLNAN